MLQEQIFHPRPDLDRPPATNFERAILEGLVSIYKTHIFPNSYESYYLAADPESAPMKDYEDYTRAVNTDHAEARYGQFAILIFILEIKYLLHLEPYKRH